jgi:hypothetical protein
MARIIDGAGRGKKCPPGEQAGIGSGRAGYEPFEEQIKSVDAKAAKRKETTQKGS